MSSSKGNVVLLEDAIQEFGADTVRMFLLGSAEPWQDFDWRNELVHATRKQIERFSTTVTEASSQSLGHQAGHVGIWLLSRLQSRIEQVTVAIEGFQTRQALQEAFHGIEADLKWYRQRRGTAPAGPELTVLINTWIRLLAPYIPYTCERLWSHLGERELVTTARWPESDQALVNIGVELAEELIQRTVDDMASILKLIKITPISVTLFCAPAWKWQVFQTIGKSNDRREAVREVMQDAMMRKRGKAAAEAANQVATLIHRLSPNLVDRLMTTPIDEIAIFSEAKEYLEREFGVPVQIQVADRSTHPKAANALPFKPAIHIG